jgi:O-6-methylguanine DNA methyltransferase
MKINDGNPMVRIESPDGFFTASFSTHGLASLRFPEPQPAANDSDPIKIAEEARGWIQLTCSALQRALRGLPPEELPPLDLKQGSAFQQEVWQFLLTIPRGEVRTYGQIAQILDYPNASRAVGQACGANPIPVLVPCHRVVAGNGALGGFSAGLAWKQLLLEREQVRFESTKSRVRISAFA